jgi:hypothetical protein
MRCNNFYLSDQCLWRHPESLSKQLLELVYEIVTRESRESERGGDRFIFEK